MTIVNDQAVTSFDRAYMACAETHTGGARDTSEVDLASRSAQ